MVIKLIKSSGKTRKDVAEALGVSKGVFDNKLFRSSFSIKDLAAIADCCGFEIFLVPKDYKKPEGVEIQNVSSWNPI